MKWRKDENLFCRLRFSIKMRKTLFIARTAPTETKTIKKTNKRKGYKSANTYIWICPTIRGTLLCRKGRTYGRTGHWNKRNCRQLGHLSDRKKLTLSKSHSITSKIVFSLSTLPIFLFPLDGTHFQSNPPIVSFLYPLILAPSLPFILLTFVRPPSPFHP